MAQPTKKQRTIRLAQESLPQLIDLFMDCNGAVEEKRVELADAKRILEQAKKNVNKKRSLLKQATTVANEVGACITTIKDPKGTYLPHDLWYIILVKWLGFDMDPKALSRIKPFYKICSFIHKQKCLFARNMLTTWRNPLLIEPDENKGQPFYSIVSKQFGEAYKGRKRYIVIFRVHYPVDLERAMRYKSSFNYQIIPDHSSNTVFIKSTGYVDE